LTTIQEDLIGLGVAIEILEITYKDLQATFPISSQWSRYKHFENAGSVRQSFQNIMLKCWILDLNAVMTIKHVWMTY